MKDTMRVLLCGLGGYGEFYASYFLDSPVGARLCAVVEPFPEKCSRLPDLKARSIPVFASLDEFYAGRDADLVIIASPHHFHAPQAAAALDHESHVLCEKPLCPTIQEALALREKSDECGRIVAVGFQRVFTDAMQRLKQDIREGALGGPRRLKALIFWPRSREYYGRNRWAGKIKTGDGAWVLDSPVMNANAHFLHEMLYLLGPQTDACASLLDVEAELCRVNDIENYDTAALRCRTVDGAEILLYASHATSVSQGPVFEYAFEKADVSCPKLDGDIVARFHDGTTRSYGMADHGASVKITRTIEAIRGGAALPCGIEAAIGHILCADGAQDSCPRIAGIPSPMTEEEIREGEHYRFARLLEEVLTDCYRNAALPSERGSILAGTGARVNLTAYRWFPGGDKNV